MMGTYQIGTIGVDEGAAYRGTDVISDVLNGWRR